MTTVELILYMLILLTSYWMRQENILCIFFTSGLVYLSLFLWMEAAVEYPEGLGVSYYKKEASHWVLFAQGKVFFLSHYGIKLILLFHESMKNRLIMETLNGNICINALFCYNDVKNSDPLSLRIFLHRALWITHTHTHKSIFSLHSNFTASQEPRIF